MEALQYCQVVVELRKSFVLKDMGAFLRAWYRGTSLVDAMSFPDNVHQSLAAPTLNGPSQDGTITTNAKRKEDG